MTVTTVTPVIELTPAWRELLAERAGLMEDGGLSPAEADVEALVDILARLAGGEKVEEACPCRACQ